MSRDIGLPKFEKFLPKHYQVHYNKQDRIWECGHGDRYWQIFFKSSDSGRTKFQGAEVDFIWFDEEPQKTEIFNECMMRLIDREGIWWMTATPVLGTAWMKSISEQEGVLATYGSMWDNPYLPEEEVKREAAKLPEEERLVRIEGQYIVFGGKPVFRTYIKELNQRLQNLKKEPSPLIGHIESYAA
jgi:phage terminase large subunit-like protein